MAEQYEVKVTIGDAQVEVRGAQDGVVEIVRALSDMLAHRNPAQVLDRSLTGPVAEPPRPRLVDARSFFAEKSPSTQAEAIAVAAFYLSELAPEDMRSPTINKEQATDIFRQARFKLPKRVEQVLVNTQTAGYVNRVGVGEYKLSTVGYNLVEHTLGSDA